MIGSSKAPLHVQLADLLRSQIEAGRFAPGDRLPTEKELMVLHEVSSSTVRQAVLTLAQEGLLYRKAGKGTFVNQPRIERDLLTFSGFSEETLAKGFRPGSRSVDLRWSSPSPGVAMALGVPVDERVYEIERVRTADDAIVALETVYFPRSLGERLEQCALANAALTSILEDHLGLRLERAYQVIRAVAASPRVARRLEIKPGVPLLQIERTAVLRDDRICYFSDSYYRADRYDYKGWVERRQRPMGLDRAAPDASTLGRTR